MKSSKEYADIYKDLVSIYEQQRELELKSDINRTTPTKTVAKMLEKYSIDDIKTAFGIVAHIKVDHFHDGRISGYNRNWIKMLPFPEDCQTWNHDNPFMNGTMDSIHPAHIDQLLTAIRKSEEAINTRDKFEVMLGPNTKQFWVYNNITELMIDIPTDVLNAMDEIVRENGGDADAISLAEDWLYAQINSNNPPDWVTDADYMYDGDLEI